MAHWWTVNLTLIRDSQVIHSTRAWVRDAEQGAVWGYAAQQKAQCGVRSAEEATLRIYEGSRKIICGGTQTK